MMRSARAFSPTDQENEQTAGLLPEYQEQACGLFVRYMYTKGKRRNQRPVAILGPVFLSCIHRLRLHGLFGARSPESGGGTADFFLKQTREVIQAGESAVEGDQLDALTARDKSDFGFLQTFPDEVVLRGRRENVLV